MLASVASCAVVGLEGALVEVEVDLGPGLIAMTVVGLPDAAVQEARERVKAAVRNAGATFPLKRVTVNLAPAELKKEGASYDLPIAVALLLASDQLLAETKGTMFLGELALDGALRHTEGVLPMVALARDRGFHTVVVPEVDAREAALIDGIQILPVPSLRALIDHLRGRAIIAPFLPDTSLLDRAARADELSEDGGRDFQHVKGQQHAKRALEIAASGGHNVLMAGSPGSGKTLLARAVPTILPPLSIEEALEVTKIYSVAGLLPSDVPVIARRPFRAPHHTISNAGLVGGGRWPNPGEISLAHRGVLFLDELPEFGQAGLDVLRQPLEDGTVTISRAQGAVTFPAKFILVGAMNPCPCGWAGDDQHACTCSTTMVQRYQKRLSGPLLDRIDLHLQVRRVPYEKLTDDRSGEPSSLVRKRVIVARQVQRARFSEMPRLTCNADMGPADVRTWCGVDPVGQTILKVAIAKMGLSARAFHRCLKVARTIADLEGTANIGSAHVAEALTYRPQPVGT
jgi:magnesium chelatase family protein